MNQPTPNVPEQGDSAPLIDFKALANWVRFAFRSAARHKRVMFLVVSSVVLLAAAAMWFLPKTYHVETMLLAQKNQVLAVKNDQGGEAPTRAAAETVLRRENLVALVRQTNLVNELALRRAPAQRLKHWVTSFFAKPRTEKEEVEDLARYLQTKLNVWTGDGTVTIQIDWPDGPTAYSLVQQAQDTFLEARHLQEIQTVAEAESIMEGHATELRTQVDKAVEEVQALRAEKEKTLDAKKPKAAEEAPTRQPAISRPMPVAASAAPDPSVKKRLAEVDVLISAKERAVASLDDFRQRRLAELQAQLEEKRAVYTDAHPAVVDARQAIVAASEDSPQVAQLKTELARLHAEADQLRASLGAAAPPAVSAYRGGGDGRVASKAKDLPGDVIRIEQEPAEDSDPEIVFARSRLRFAIEAFQQLQTQIQTASIELDTAQAAFKYRYVVVVPAEIPKGPVKPKVTMILIAALLGGLLLGVLATVMVDLRLGKLLEPWQVQQSLGLPVLAEIHLPHDNRFWDASGPREP